MSHYPAFICENGHVVSSFSDSCTDKYCTQCGRAIISKCPNCNQTIKGEHRENFTIGWKFKAPAYCPGCGKPFPWTIEAIEATSALIKESELPFDEQQRIISILPDAMTETPNTQLAAVRIGKAIDKAGKFVAQGLGQFAINYGCELLQKLLDLL